MLPALAPGPAPARQEPCRLLILGGVRARQSSPMVSPSRQTQKACQGRNSLASHLAAGSGTSLNAWLPAASQLVVVEH